MVWGVLIVLAVLTAGFLVAFALEVRAAERRQREGVERSRVASLPTGRRTGGAGATKEAATG